MFQQIYKLIILKAAHNMTKEDRKAAGKPVWTGGVLQLCVIMVLDALSADGGKEVSFRYVKLWIHFLKSNILICVSHVRNSGWAHSNVGCPKAWCVVVLNNSRATHTTATEPEGSVLHSRRWTWWWGLQITCMRFALIISFSFRCGLPSCCFWIDFFTERSQHLLDLRFSRRIKLCSSVFWLVDLGLKMETVCSSETSVST
jgi:hypothetical protein